MSTLEAPPAKARSFLKDRGVPSPVRDSTVVFYPISVRATLPLRTVGAALAQSLQVLFGTNEFADSKRITRAYPGGGNETEFEPPAQAMVEYRAKSKATAIEGAFNCVLHPDNQTIIAGLIVDSAREEQFTVDEVLDFPVEDYIQLCRGMLKANAGVLAPFRERFLAAAQALKAKIGIQEPSSPAPDRPQPKPVSDSSPPSEPTSPKSDSPSGLET